MKIMIMPNFDKKNALSCTHKVCLKLLELGGLVLMQQAHRKYVDIKGICYGEFSDLIKECDVVLAIGGDGTIIHSAKHAVEFDKPVLGINTGRLGFLAGMEQTEIDDLKYLVAGDYRLERRMMLEAVHQTAGGQKSYLALNDVVVSKGSLSRMVDMDVYCMDRFVSSYRADGVILSTPTGSTAYALSAGGPIVEPGLNVISLTPISPHSLFARSILFGGENVLTIHVRQEAGTEAYLTVDGEQGIRLEDGDFLVVRQSRIDVKLINLYGQPFYEVLNEKFLTRAREL